MAHGLEQRNGRIEMAYAGATPWHGLGVQLANAVNSEEMAVQAGLTWDVLKIPLVTMDGWATSDFGNFRSDTHEHLGTVSADYRVLGNAEMFRFMDNLLANGIVKYESAGALFGGKIVWALARVPATVK